jgi:Alpha-tubulin suppressor and related RCC1 domain-containing proteins
MKKLTTLFLLVSILCINSVCAQNCWQSVSVGNGYTIALKEDGTLWSWGLNNQGQLGNGTLIDKTIPTQIGTGINWAQISAGHNFAIALKTDGTIWGWGSNTFYQLGGTSSSDKTTPVQIGTATNWQSVSAGYNHIAALASNATIWLWGSNYYGQLGDGTNIDKNSPTQIGTPEWKAVYAGSGNTIALKKDGTLWTWGSNTNGALGNGTLTDKNIPGKIGTSNEWKRIYPASMAMKADSLLWAWGYNGYGQLGNGLNGSFNDLENPSQIGSTHWKEISPSGDHTLGIKADGTLWAWGYNENGKLGDGTNADRALPTQIGSETDWETVYANYHHTMALKTNGSLWAWGTNSNGQLGDGSKISRSTPVPITCPTITLETTKVLSEMVVNVYPNPSQGDFLITVDESVVENGVVIILNMTGSVVYEKQFSGKVIKVDLTGQPQGIYYIQLQNDYKLTYQEKIIKL